MVVRGDFKLHAKDSFFANLSRLIQTAKRQTSAWLICLGNKKGQSLKEVLKVALKKP